MAATMTMLAIALAAGGAATQAYGQWKAGGQAKKQGEAEQRAAESQAQVADYNAAVAELQAIDATQRGEEEANRYREGVRTLIGSQRAGFAAANVDVGFGSAVDVQADATMLGELDALTIRTNAAREAWGFKVEAEDLRRRAEVTRREGVAMAEAGRVAQTSARVGAIGTLASTGSSLLQQRYGFGRRS